MDAVHQKSGEHAKGSDVGFRLRVLVCSIGTVSDASAEAADQKPFIAHQLQVQVGAAFCIGDGLGGIIIRIMVAGDVHQRDVQKSNQGFEVGVGQVSTPNDQFDIAEMSVVAEAVQAFHDFIADGKDLHKRVLCRRTGFPARGTIEGVGGKRK